MRRARRTIALLTLGLLAATPITAQAQNEFQLGSAAQLPWLSPLEVEPGGTIRGSAGKSGFGCLSTSITSPGFAAPMVLGIWMPGANRGETTVITTPGVYTATKHCNGSSTETLRFTILGAPPTTKPTPPPSKPKPPVVKPRGAADTGGGGTA